jgi:hypothetical protein
MRQSEGKRCMARLSAVLAEGERMASRVATRQSDEAWNPVRA